ncbi:phage/plasmid replication domain-containing protein [Pontibacter akesuensis]|uniref:Uncharacterized protein n=1 Tax=Pontibacter akesuensis TaxID=388950 RepID=A0A1I7JX79_9BACT|nr:phage/plasmid replication protein [Pontibacter akesuensis]GHA76860.1 hypothetical protein GCM10007389_33580 [Pontibacter akesuensis]SFU89800.1 hypothetical protein SAMN04487941_3145 [Pontibacter akesuensis]
MLIAAYLNGLLPHKTVHPFLSQYKIDSFCISEELIQEVKLKNQPQPPDSKNTLIGGIGYDTINAYRNVNEEQYKKIEENIIAIKNVIIKTRSKSEAIRAAYIQYEKSKILVYLKKNLHVSVHVSLPSLLNNGCNVLPTDSRNATKAINLINKILGFDKIIGLDFRTFKLTRVDITANYLVDGQPSDLLNTPAPSYFKRAAIYDESVYFVATNKAIKTCDLRFLKKRNEKSKDLRQALRGYRRQLLVYEKEIDETELKAWRFEARLKKNRIIRNQLKYEATVMALEDHEFYQRCISYFDTLLKSMIKKSYKRTAGLIKKAYLEGKTSLSAYKFDFWVNYNKG